MNVHGYEVPQTVEDACVAAMSERFSKGDVELAAIAAGAPKWVGRDLCAHRIADRLLQRERKAGRIALDGRVWVAKSK